MTTSNDYDGTGKLGEALATLCGYSPKSQVRTAELIKQAKDGLNITSKAKLMPTDTKLAIWRWHVDRLHSTQQTVEIISQNPINEAVEIIAQDDDDGTVNNLEVIRVAFYVTKDGKRERCVIALDGFYINGLIAATGITRQDVPRWVQQAVDDWINFYPHYGITRQVKYLIVRTMTEAITPTKRI